MAKKNKIVKYPSSRVLHAVIFMANKEGKVMMDLEQLQQIISDHEGGYLNYAFILHDKDTYDAEAVYNNRQLNHKTYVERYQILADVKGLPIQLESELKFAYDADIDASAKAYADAQFPEIVKGEDKPAHWHVILNFSSARQIDEIARWFKLKDGSTLEPNWIEIKTGRGALENAYNYLVHKNDKLKYPYDGQEVYASFDYLEHLAEALRKAERAQKYDVEKDEINELIDKVADGNLTLGDIKKILPFAVYHTKEKAFISARQHYVREVMPMPYERQVYYIDAEGVDENTGAGGVGKSLISKAYAKQLAAKCGADKSLAFDELRDYIFVAGNKDVFLDNYDGQPVLFIDDMTADDLVAACHGVSTVKTLLDPYPVRTNINVKFSSLVCTAQYVIINGIQSLSKFKRELSKFDKAPEQFDRRIWGGIHVINGSDLEVWINRGLFSNMPDLQNQIEVIAKRKHSISMIAREYDGEARFVMENAILTPLLERLDEREQSKEENAKITDVSAALDSKLFKEINTQIIIDDDFVDADKEIINIFSPADSPKVYISAKNPVAELVDKMFEIGMYNYDDAELYVSFAKVAVEVLAGQDKTKNNKEYFSLALKAKEMIS